MPRDQLFGMGQQSLACRSQPHAGAGALQKRLTDLGLQPLHLHAECGLGAPDLGGGKADRTRSGNYDEVFQKREIKHGNIRKMDIGLKYYQLD
ncbi:hypothetical protein D3C73_466740 [compost metagenome]